jgi:ribosomal protein S6--L-glutamate ligase
MATKFGLISLGSVSSNMILEEAKKIFDEADLIDIRKIEIRMDSGKTSVLYDGNILTDYDCLLMRGSYKYSTLLYGLSEIYKDKCFVPIDSNAHLLAHNKFMTHLYLSKSKNLKMPNTYFAAKITETKSFLKTLNYPIILKFPSGTHGKGVIFAESASSANSMVDALDVFKQPVLVQDYINIKSDIRIIVAGNKIIGSMKRIANNGDIRANAHQGGNAEPFIPNLQIKEMCIEAAKLINAQICAVDIIESDYGPLILEVNTSPGLQKISEVTKKNIAEEMVKFMYDETTKIKGSKEKVETKSVMSNLGIEEIGEREFETELIVRNGKIVLPEFVYKMGKLREGENIHIRIEGDKIELKKGHN